jgi:hypothetical protein
MRLWWDFIVLHNLHIRRESAGFLLFVLGSMGFELRTFYLCQPGVQVLKFIYSLNT